MTSYFVFISLVLANHAQAFAPVRSVRPRCFDFQAKRHPTADFSLEALEAFEAELELRDAEQEKTTVEECEDHSAALEGYEIVTFTVPSELHNKRIDAAIASLLESKGMSRSACGNLVATGQVYLLSDGTRVLLTRKATKVEEDQQLEIHLEDTEAMSEIVPQDIPLDILFEDAHMIVLNKAASMVVHPAAGNWEGTVVNALAFYLQKSTHGAGDFFEDAQGSHGESLSLRPGIVHRLDKGTTGVLVVAKTTSALTTLSEAFAARRVKKTYLAVTVGNPGKSATIDKPIGRHPIYRQRMRVVPDPHKKNSSGMAPKDRLVDPRTPSQAGRRALSFVKTLHFDGKLSLVQVRIETGRTHQIRVHLQDRTTPVYGDDVYGLTDWNKRLSKTHAISRPLLHAYTLEIDHPVTGEAMSFRAPLASDMIKVATAICPDGATDFPDIFASPEIANGSVVVDIK